jgi:hypothetical protein
MNRMILKYSSVFVLTLALLETGRDLHASEPSDKDGTLVVLVTWGDVDNTPASHVYVEAHGFVVKYREERSFVFKMAHAGRYEASLTPGVYDIFVSEGTSEPRCRRVLISAGSTAYWTLKLEIDEVYTDKMRGVPVK